MSSKEIDVIVHGQHQITKFKVQILIKASGGTLTELTADLNTKLEALGRMGIFPEGSERVNPVTRLGFSEGNTPQDGWTPKCPKHHSEMWISKVQKSSTATAYYCARKDGEVYCKCRATVHKDTGEIEHWEVSK